MMARKDNKYIQLILRLFSLLALVVMLAGCEKMKDSAENVLIHLQSSYVFLMNLIISVAYLSGALFVVKGIFAFKIYGEQRTLMSSQISVRVPVTYFAVGIGLIFLPRMISIMSNTLFMRPELTMGFTEGEGFTPLEESVYNLIKLMGLIAVVRAFFIASVPQPQGGGGQGGLAKAAIHFLGGLAALNVEYMVQLLKNIT